jgi:hypothetical protein
MFNAEDIIGEGTLCEGTLGERPSGEEGGKLPSGKGTGFVRFCEDEEGDTAVDVLGVVLG